MQASLVCIQIPSQWTTAIFTTDRFLFSQSIASHRQSRVGSLDSPRSTSCNSARDDYKTWTLTWSLLLLGQIFTVSVCATVCKFFNLMLLLRHDISWLDSHLAWCHHRKLCREASSGNTFSRVKLCRKRTGSPLRSIYLRCSGTLRRQTRINEPLALMVLHRTYVVNLVMAWVLNARQDSVTLNHQNHIFQMGHLTRDITSSNLNWKLFLPLLALAEATEQFFAFTSLVISKFAFMVSLNYVGQVLWTEILYLTGVLRIILIRAELSILWEIRVVGWLHDFRGNARFCSRRSPLWTLCL